MASTQTDNRPLQPETPEAAAPAPAAPAPAALATTTTTSAAPLPRRSIDEKAGERDVANTSVLPMYHDGKEGADIVDVRDSESGRSEEEEGHKWPSWTKHVILAGLGLLILAWWISGLVLEATRHRWIVQTVWAWFFILLIISQYVPNSVVTKPIGRVWGATISKPFFSLPYLARIGLGVAALVGLVIGPAFGFTPGEGTNYGDRLRGILCLIIFQAGFWLASKSRKHIDWATVIVGLIFQQIVALFVLKTKAGFDIFRWIAIAATDLLSQAYKGSVFFFDQDIVYERRWFLATVLCIIIFFLALVQLLYYWGVMQWLIVKFGWFFFRTLRVSGAESVIVTATPFIGQGESACMAKSFFPHMTPSEIHQTMTSGFATASGSTLIAYTLFGAQSQQVITSAIMSIPASIAISKLRYPEQGEPLTKGRMIIPKDNDRASGAFEAFSNGAAFGLKVAGLIFCNILVILALVGAIDGLLTWIGRSFGITALTLELVLGYIFYPVAWLIGVPKRDLLHVGRLLATKLIANEFVAYGNLQVLREAGQISARADTIAAFALCGFGNLSSLGIQVGVLSALAPNQKRVVTQVAASALICGFISTLQTAAIAGVLL